MNEKKKIACFFTGGYTELTSMKIFIRKINTNVELIQLCPAKKRASSSQIKNRHTESINKSHSGLTGNDLIDFIKNLIQKPVFQNEDYDAILIEDDKDNRFMEILSDGTANLNLSEWDSFKNLVIKQLHEICPNIPIIFLFSAPEVEAWFLADWDNSFAKIYKNDLKAGKNSHFEVVFRKYINDNILTKRYRDSIESYGYFESKYKKLSEEIQNALKSAELWESISQAETNIHYSKKKHGSTMLENINPEIVLHHCNHIFKEGFLLLKDL